MGDEIVKLAATFALLILPVCAAAQIAAPAAGERDADFHNRQQLFLLQLKPSDGWSATSSGLRYRRTKAGPGGPSPSPTDVVTIHYTGRFIEGGEFDSSVSRGERAKFPLPRLIKGWQEGVPLMRVGDTFEFAIPQHLAYGLKGKGPIPPGATLLFTIELFATAPAEAPQ
jgi:FKBP-type peptidyl-prolyl cis-trans isomerase